MRNATESISFSRSAPLFPSRLRVLGVATQGTGGDDEARLRSLLENFHSEFFPFDRAKKRSSGISLFQKIRRDRPDLVVLEGTGLAGGIAVIFGRLLAKIPYILSSGDAVGPFVQAQVPTAGPFFKFYEKILIRLSAGFIGWTPYLAGRALTLGAPRAMTAAGWAPSVLTEGELRSYRQSIRRELNIPEETIVVGIVGSLAWNKRVGYCYGYELVRAIQRVSRADVRALIVGDGSGRGELERLAGPALGKTVLMTGRVQRDRVPVYLACMDFASLPQSVDQVGAFRYSTKLTEYMAAGLPVVTGQLPFSYDLPGDWMWRLPGDMPWSDSYIAALAQLLDDLTLEELRSRREAVPKTLPVFEREFQIKRVTEFLSEAREAWWERRGVSINP